MLVFFATSVFAAPLEDMPQASSTGGKCAGLRTTTGELGKGFSKQFADIKAVCEDVVPLCEVETNGATTNVEILAEKKEGDIGYASLDILTEKRKTDPNIAALQVVAALNSNYLHPVVAVDGYRKRIKGIPIPGTVKVIKRVSDARGLPVVCVGSAVDIVRNINNQQGLNFEISEAKKDATAFDAVKSGIAAIAFTNSGYPSGTIKKLTLDDNLTIVNFDLPVNDPYKIKIVNYRNMGAYNINTLSAPNVLISRPYTSGEKAQQVSALRQCIVNKLPELKQGDYEPSWNEVDKLDESYGLPVFKSVK